MPELSPNQKKSSEPKKENQEIKKNTHQNFEITKSPVQNSMNNLKFEDFYNEKLVSKIKLQKIKFMP